MAHENEIKIKYMENPFEVEKILKEYGAELIDSISQEDIYFDFDNGHLFEIDHVIRIRYENKVPLCFEFKTIFHTPNRKEKWYIEEERFEFPIKDITRLVELFNRLGLDSKEILSFTLINLENLKQILFNNRLKEYITIKKNRKVFKKSSISFMLDKVHKLGNFLEIETSDENPEEILTNLKLKDGYDKVILGYTNLYLKYVLNKPHNKMERFKENPTWNVLDTETEIYNKINEGK